MKLNIKTEDCFYIKINYRNQSIASWFTEFKFEGSTYTWCACADPAIINSLNEELLSEFISFKQYERRIAEATPKILLLGPDNIESIFQTRGGLYTTYQQK